MNFKELIEKGMKKKEQGDTNLAIGLYKDAFDIAENDTEKLQVWDLILHIHTDKMLAVLIEIAEIRNCNVSDIKSEWVFGTNVFEKESNNPKIDGYVRPNKESLFR